MHMCLEKLLSFRPTGVCSSNLPIGSRVTKLIIPTGPQEIAMRLEPKVGILQ